MKKYDYSNRGPLVKVEISPGRYVKMYQHDAAARGLLQKEKPPVMNKMRSPEPSTKEAAPQQEENLQQEEKEKDDFTEIEGIGEATCKALYEHGIQTFDDLLHAEDVSYLNSKAKAAIKAWREAMV
jgi:predicted flap endonuclease-1-like 5' DNA nuclease